MPFGVFDDEAMSGGPSTDPLNDKSLAYPQWLDLRNRQLAGGMGDDVVAPPADSGRTSSLAPASLDEGDGLPISYDPASGRFRVLSSFSEPLPDTPAVATADAAPPAAGSGGLGDDVTTVSGGAPSDSQSTIAWMDARNRQLAGDDGNSEADDGVAGSAGDDQIVGSTSGDALDAIDGVNAYDGDPGMGDGGAPATDDQAAPPTSAGNPDDAVKQVRAREGGGAIVGDLISKDEGTSGPGGYDLHYGGSGAWYPPDEKKNLSQLTLDDWLRIGPQLYKRNHSSAMGKHQFITGTLKGLKSSMGLTGQEIMTPAMQDRLMREQLRSNHFDDFLNDRKDKEGRPWNAARLQRKIAGTWDSWAADNSDRSATGHPARIRTEEILNTLNAAKQDYQAFVKQRLENGYSAPVTEWR